MLINSWNKPHPPNPALLYYIPNVPADLMPSHYITIRKWLFVALEISSGHIVGTHVVAQSWLCHWYLVLAAPVVQRTRRWSFWSPRNFGLCGWSWSAVKEHVSALVCLWWMGQFQFRENGLQGQVNLRHGHVHIPTFQLPIYGRPSEFRVTFWSVIPGWEE